MTAKKNPDKPRAKSAEKKTGAEHISKITVEGFKSIRDRQTLELRPLTILAGANSSGKSSIMQPLLLLKQTLEAPFDPGPLLINGPNIEFSWVGQLFFGAAGKEPRDSFSVGFELEESRKLSLNFAKIKEGKKETLELSSMEVVDGKTEYTLKEDMEPIDLAERITNRVPHQDVIEQSFEGTLSAVRDRCFFYRNHTVHYSQETVSTKLRNPAEVYTYRLLNTIHLPGYRGNPGRDYQATAVGRRFPGVFQDYFASIVASWKENGDGRLKELGGLIQELGLTWKVDAERLDDTRIELRVGRLPAPARGGARDLVNIADVGFGVSQVMPVLVALLVAEAGQLVYIEEPEIHLHPRAQHKLAKALADAAKRGAIVVAETHSTVLLRGIQTMVAKGELQTDKVILHWFSRDDKTGASRVAETELNEKGAYGEWPQDFDDVTLGVDREYLDAVRAKRRGE